jgi:hypothetical protein
VASLACWLIGLVGLINLLTHWLFYHCLAIAVKTAALRDATSAKKNANVAALYFCVTSLLHVHLLMRETMWWWLALVRKKMCWCIASFGKSYHEFFILGFGIQATHSIPTMVMCYIMQNNCLLPGFNK